MARRRKSDAQKNHEVDLLVWMLKFASLISRPMRDGVADPAGLSALFAAGAAPKAVIPRLVW